MYISEAYKEQIRLKHEENPEWGNSAMHYWDLIEPHVKGSVLDFGCGKGALKSKIPNIVEYDPGIDGKEEIPEPCDTVLCIDVMEHIQPSYLNDTLELLAKVTKEKAVFVISTKLAKHKLPDGNNAHLIVQKAEWWREVLAEFLEVKEFKQHKDWVYIVACPHQDQI